MTKCLVVYTGMYYQYSLYQLHNNQLRIHIVMYLIKIG